jgi:nucleotide-binding universal stress UspA family protein
MKVLIGTDGSDDAVAAAAEGLKLLAAPEKVVVACVVEPPGELTAGAESGFAGGMASPGEVDQAWNEVRKEADEALARTVAVLPEGTPIETATPLGSPGPALVDFAREVGADVMVVGSRGQGALKRLLLGSVSNHVIHNAACAVVVVRPKEG